MAGDERKLLLYFRSLSRISFFFFFFILVCFVCFFFFVNWVVFFFSPVCADWDAVELGKEVPGWMRGRVLLSDKPEVLPWVKLSRRLDRNPGIILI